MHKNATNKARGCPGMHAFNGIVDTGTLYGASVTGTSYRHAIALFVQENAMERRMHSSKSAGTYHRYRGRFDSREGINERMAGQIDSSMSVHA